jgi:hypothetical protein
MNGCTSVIRFVELFMSMVGWMDFETRYLINVKFKQYVLIIQETTEKFYLQMRTFLSIY